MIKKTFALISLTAYLIFFTLSNAYAERSYGPVKQKDYLGIIVKKAYPKTQLKSQQIMVAILRANPKAFNRHNIHLLKAGSTLDLPSEDIIKTINNQKAIKLINEHYALFKKGVRGNIALKPLPKSGAVASNNVKTSDKTSRADNKIPESTKDTTKVDNKTSKAPESTEDTTKTDDKTSGAISESSENTAKVDGKTPEATPESGEDTEKSDGKTSEVASENAEDTAKTDDKTSEVAPENADDTAKADNKTSETTAESTKDTDTKAEKPKGSSLTVDIIDNPKLGINDKKILADKSTNQTYGKLDSLENIREQQNKTIDMLDQQIEALQSQVNNKTANSSDSATKDEAQEDVVIEKVYETLETAEPSATKEAKAAEDAKNAISADTATGQGSDSKGFDAFNKPWQLAILFGTLGLLALVTYRAFKKPTVPNDIGIPLTRTKTSAITAKERVLTRDQLLDPVIKTTRPKLRTAATLAASEQSGKALTIEQEHKDVELKINMARAYIDMDYIEAATEVLQEASNSSSQEQRAIIDALLASTQQEPHD